VKNKLLKSDKAFTLIELLVVIAIIGILSAVVVASLNSAREKGKISMIKSTLKNMQSQAELTYNDTGSYVSLYNTSTYDCIGPLSKMAESLTNQGVTVKCHSIDTVERFGATAIIYDTNVFKAWSTDQNGVVTWDQKGVNSTGAYVDTYTYSDMTFAVSNSACAKAGGRLPSIEQLYTLGRAYGAASFIATGTATYKPTSTGFVADRYWSSSSVTNDLSQAYYVYFLSGNLYAAPISTQSFVRCVR
jgi:prepilin-type N-terminal cleavage/methylation domain-containing protein